MANTTTHLQFGRDVLKQLSQTHLPLAEQIGQHLDAFLFGTMGPDFLFALREIGDKSARYCNVMQYCKVFEVFDSIAGYLHKKPDPRQFSYAMGLMCHYVLDFNIHPYVLYFTEQVLPKWVSANQQMGIHSMVEMEVDTFVITQLMGFKDANDYCPKHDLATSLKTKNAIANLYVCAVNGILGFNTSAFKVKFAMRLARFTVGLFTDKSGKRRAKYSRKEKGLLDGKKTIRNMLRPSEYHGKLDFLNLERTPYRRVRNLPEMDTKTIPELLTDSALMCVGYLRDFADWINLNTPMDRRMFKVNYEGIGN
jgi:hypothetical protein